MGALPAALKALLAAHTPGDYYVLKLVGPDNVTRYYSDAPVSSASVGPILARVKTWGQITRACSDQRNRPDLGQGTRITVVDNDRALATMFATYDAAEIRGSLVEIYLAHKDLSSVDWSKRFRGRLVRWPSPEPLSYELNVERDNAPVNAFIPRQPITSGDRPDADPEQIGEPLPLLYGQHLSADTGGKGSVPCGLVDTVLDRHMLMASEPSRLLSVYLGGTLQGSGYSMGTGVISGRKQSIIDFTSDTGTSPVTADVIGVRLGTVQGVVNPAGAEERNAASQLKHILVNHVFNDWKSGAFFADSTAPIDVASFAAARAYLDARAPPNGMQSARWIGERLRAIDLMAEWALNWEMRLYLTPEGAWACKALDFAETDNYLAGPLLTTAEVDQIGTDPDDSFLVSSVTVRTGWNEASNGFTEGLTLEDAIQGAALGAATDELLQTWNTQAGPGDGLAIGRDVGSRRLWLYRKVRTKVRLDVPLHALDADLMSRVWLSHFAGPDMAGQGSSREPWEARELLVLQIEEDPSRRRAVLTCLDMRPLRVMTWDALWSRLQPGTTGDGIPRMYVGRRSYTRNTKKWVRRPSPDVDVGVQFYEISDVSDLSSSTNAPIVEPIDKDGTLLEFARPNYINNSYDGTGAGAQGVVTDAADIIFETASAPTSAKSTSYDPTPAARRDYSCSAAGTPARVVLSAWRRIIKSSAPTDPSEVAGMTLYLLADDNPGADNTSIANWYNRLTSANPGVSFAQATAANQPKVFNGVLNGRRAVRFDGTNDLMAASGFDLSNLIAASGNNGTIVAVFKPANASNAGHATAYENDLIFGCPRAAIALKQNGANTDMLAYASDGASKVATKASITIGSARIGLWEINGAFATTQTLYGGIDEYKCSTFASVACNAITPLTDVPQLGSWSSINFFDGDLFALMIWNRGLLLHERHSILRWINSYYGLAIPSWTELGLKYSIQRSSPDTNWFRASDQTWQAAETKNAFPTLDGSLNGAAGICGDVVNSSTGLGTPSVRIWNEDEGHAEARLYHVQLEDPDWAGPLTPRCPSSPWVTTGTGGGARGIDALSISNNVGYRNVYGPRGSLVLEWTPWWATGDLQAGQDITIWHCFHDSSNELRLFYRQSDSSIVFRLRRSGTNYDAVKALTVTKYTRVRLGARWCSTEGELGLAPYTVSVFVNQVKGTDAVAAGAITEAALSRQSIGYRMRAWKQPSEISGLQGWWKADEGLYVDLGMTTLVGAGDRVHRWADQSGNNRHLGQAIPANRPTAWRFPPADGATLAAVDLPYVEFDGVNDLLGTGIALSSFIAAGAGTIISVFRADAFSAATKYAVCDNNAVVTLGANESGGTTSAFASNDDGVVDSVTSAYTAGQPLIAMWRHGGGNLKLGVNDLRDSVLASVASGNTTPLTGTLLVGGFGLSPWLGQMHEVMVYNTTLSEADCLDLGSYLLHKWSGTVYAASGFRNFIPYGTEHTFAAIRFLEISQLVWTDAEIAAKHRAMAAVV